MAYFKCSGGTNPTGNATEGDVLATKTFSNADGTDKVGTMPNRGAVSISLDASTTSYTIPAGYHNGSGTVSITTQTKSAAPSTSAQTISPDSGKLLSSVTISAVSTQEKTVTSSRSAQTVTPDSGKYLSKVTVNALAPTGTYTASSRGASLDMGATSNYRYVNTNSVPNTNSGTYTYASGSTGGTVDLGAANTYRYVNAANVYAKGKADAAITDFVFKEYEYIAQKASSIGAPLAFTYSMFYQDNGVLTFVNDSAGNNNTLTVWEYDGITKFNARRLTLTGTLPSKTYNGSYWGTSVFYKSGFIYIYGDADVSSGNDYGYFQSLFKINFSTGVSVRLCTNISAISASAEYCGTGDQFRSGAVSFAINGNYLFNLPYYVGSATAYMRSGYISAYDITKVDTAPPYYKSIASYNTTLIKALKSPGSTGYAYQAVELEGYIYFILYYQRKSDSKWVVSLFRTNNYSTATLVADIPSSVFYRASDSDFPIMFVFNSKIHLLCRSTSSVLKIFELNGSTFTEKLNVSNAILNNTDLTAAPTFGVSTMRILGVAARTNQVAIAGFYNFDNASSSSQRYYGYFMFWDGTNVETRKGVYYKK